MLMALSASRPRYTEGGWPGQPWTLGLVNGCPEKGENLARRGLSTREEEIYPGDQEGPLFKVRSSVKLFSFYIERVGV